MEENIGEKLMTILQGNPGAMSVINGFSKSLEKDLKDIVSKLYDSDKKGSSLWVLFLSSGGKKPAPNLSGCVMLYAGNDTNIAVEEQKEALQKTWDSI